MKKLTLDVLVTIAIVTVFWVVMIGAANAMFLSPEEFKKDVYTFDC